MTNVFLHVQVEMEMQKANVEKILTQLQLDDNLLAQRIEVWNKIDAIGTLHYFRPG